MRTRVTGTTGPIRQKTNRYRPVQASKSIQYRGKYPQMVLAGTGSMVTCLGLEQQVIAGLYNRHLDSTNFLRLGVRMGLFRVEASGAVHEMARINGPGCAAERLKESVATEASVHNAESLLRLQKKWRRLVASETGIRTLRGDNIDPDNTYTEKGQVKTHFNPDDYRHRPNSKAPFTTDIAGAMPTGFTIDSFLGARLKDMKRWNFSIAMAMEIAFRALVSTGFHHQLRFFSKAFHAQEGAFDPHRIGLVISTGIGPHREHTNLNRHVFEGGRVGAFDLANSISNIHNGLVARYLGIKGPTEAPARACDGTPGSLVHARRMLLLDEVDAVVAGGWETAIGPVGISGFDACQAMITNKDLVENIAAMVDEGVLDRAIYEPLLQEVRERGDVMNLPASFPRLASTPFSKYRAGFVLGDGGGAVLVTTKEKALALGLPILGILAGAASATDGLDSIDTTIMDLGDGLGSAIQAAFRQAMGGYEGLDADAIGLIYAHGTSTPTNGNGERWNIQNALQILGRSAGNPVPIAADKGMLAHRVAGNAPFPVIDEIFRTSQIFPTPNYLQPGYVPETVDRKPVFKRLLDQEYPLTRIVGRAGLGEGESVPFEGEAIMLQGAGFGGAYSANVILKPSASTLDLSQKEWETHLERAEVHRQAGAQKLREIDLGQTPYCPPDIEGFIRS